MIALVPDSTSEILRASHIVVVRLESITLGPTAPAGDFLVRREAHVRLSVERAFKGEWRDEPGRTIETVLSVFQNEGPRFTALPGVWSAKELEEGRRFVLFCNAPPGPAERIVVEPRCFQCAPAETAEADVECAMLAAKPGLPLPEFLETVADRRATFGPHFARYVAWRLREPLLARKPADFSAILDQVERPGTAAVFQRIVVVEAYDLLMLYDPMPADFIARLVSGSIRLAFTDAGKSLRSPVLESLLPNLLGLEGGLTRKSAAEVFVSDSSQRLEIAELLSSRPDLPGAARLLDWVRA